MTGIGASAPRAIEQLNHALAVHGALPAGRTLSCAPPAAGVVERKAPSERLSAVRLRAKARPAGCATVGKAATPSSAAPERKKAVSAGPGPAAGAQPSADETSAAPGAHGAHAAPPYV
jgi:hypothetical protein